MEYDAGSLLTDFRKSLREVVEAKELRELQEPWLKIHSLAMAAGQPGFGGVAPVRSTNMLQWKLSSAKAKSADAASLPVVAGSRQTQNSLFLGAGHVDGAEQKSYRAVSVAVAARQEATQARAKREGEQSFMYLPPRGVALAQRSFAPIRLNVMKDEADDIMRGHEVAPYITPLPGVRRRAVLPVSRRARQAGEAILEVPHVRPEPYGEDSVAFTPTSVRPMPEPAQFDIGQALEEYFFQQSRMPPAGTTAFDPRLTPAWAGLKLPG
ncbi:MAG: hypothetical protein PHU07_07170 [Acidocella sp.]|nr:hypothetical protein [Acidocella sp.]